MSLCAPQDIAIARRIVALLPDDMIPLNRDVWGGTSGKRRVIGRLLWQAVDDKTDWLPVLEDFALFAWLQFEIERIVGGHIVFEYNSGMQSASLVTVATAFHDVSPVAVAIHAADWSGTRIEALVAALEAAKSL